MNTIFKYENIKTKTIIKKIEKLYQAYNSLSLYECFDNTVDLFYNKENNMFYVLTIEETENFNFFNFELIETIENNFLHELIEKFNDNKNVNFYNHIIETIKL